MAISTRWHPTRRTRLTDAARERAPGPKRWGRRLLRWAGRTLAVVLALGTVGALYELAAEAADARAYPPPGQMVDVGGHRLHINCVGTGSPTVVIEAGLGDWSGGWSRVQAEAAHTTRVCTYDRAGMGYSEAGPLPRTAERFAGELHVLLQRAGVQGPYVLVGHSMGGAPVRLFAHAHAAEVAGVVLVDAMNPPGATPAVSATPSDQGSSPTVRVLTKLLTVPARVGVVRLMTGRLAGFSPHDADAYAAQSVTPRASQTAVDEFMGVDEGNAQARQVTTLGDVPLIVLSRGLPQDDQEKWERQQTELLQLSSDSRRLFAAQSHHNIQFEQPQAAVDAIVRMVERVRGQAPR